MGKEIFPQTDFQPDLGSPLNFCWRKTVTNHRIITIQSRQPLGLGAGNWSS